MIVPLSSRVNPKNEILKYPETTPELRNQVTVIVMRCLELFDFKLRHGISDDVAKLIVVEYCISTGKCTYNPNHFYGVKDLHILLNGLKDEEFLDLLDIFVQFIIRNDQLRNSCDFDDVIKVLNSVLKSNGVDIQIVDGVCTRISEPTIQEEIINPAFMEIYRKGFKNAREELCNAFEFFKNGDNDNAISSANKSLESVIDYIIKEKRIELKKDKLSSKLSCLVNMDILPKEYECSYNALITLLQSTAVIRNRHGGHGNADQSCADDMLVQYAIDSAASAILFLVRLFYNKGAPIPK